MGLLPGGLDNGARVDPGLERAGGGEELAEPSDPVLPGHDLGGLGLPEADEREHGHGLGLELVGGPGGEGGVEERGPGLARGHDEPVLVGLPGERPEPAERGEARALGDEGADEVRVGGLLGRGDALDAHGAVRDAPLLDERRRKEEWERADGWAQFLEGQRSLFMCCGVLETKIKDWSVLCTISKSGVCCAQIHHLEMCHRQISQLKN